MGGRPTYYSAAYAFADRDVVRPRDNPPAIGIADEPDGARSIGIAYPTGWIDADDERGRQAETLWRLVVDKAEMPGRFALRRGRFVRVES